MLCRKGEIAQALASDNGITGALRLRAERNGDRTLIADAYRTAPFRLGEIESRVHCGEAEVIVQGVGPGYLPGDRIEIDISTGPEANLLVRDQAALKLFPSPKGAPAHSTIALRAEAGSRLVYLPGELIPHRHAIYKQRASIDVHPTANVAYAEIITPGRVAMEECFAFTRLDLAIDILVAGRGIVRERSRIDPATSSPAMLGRHGRFNCVGTLYLVGPGWKALGYGAAKDGARWASDGDDRYVLIRYAARTAQHIRNLIAEHLVSASRDQ